MGLPAAPAYTILIVEDNPQLREFLQDVLQELGEFTVFTAADGIEGLEQVYQVHPDCMIIDVKMPGLNGYQLVRTLRGDSETAATPLVLLTAMVQDKEQFAGLAAGTDCYLRKPVDPVELIQAIYQAIQLSADERLRRMQALAEGQNNSQIAAH